MRIRSFFFRFMKPAGDDGADTGGTDRGDDFVPTDEDLDEDANSAAAQLAAAEAAALAAGDADPDADPDADDKAKPKGKDSRIPLSRHKDILQKEREQRLAAEERLAQYEKGQQVAAINEDLTTLENNVLAMEKEYTKLLADGEIDKATEKMTQIRRAERQITETKSAYQNQVAIAQATEQARYDSALERVESAFPVLNPDHDDFDKATLGEVVEWKLFYEKQRNMTPTKALQAAVKKVVDVETKAQDSATKVAPKVDAADVAKEAAAARKKAAVGKALDATSKTPPSTTKVGLDSDKAGGSLTAKDVMKLSQDDFKNLPDDVLARMRGDEFV